MSEIVNEMIVAVRGDMSKPLNAVDRLRLYEARVAELDPGDADQILEYMEEAADEIERLRAERQRTSDLIEEVKRVLGPFASLSDNANNGQRYFLQLLVCPVGDKYGGDATDFGPKIRDARSLLSKLEGR